MSMATIFAGLAGHGQGLNLKVTNLKEIEYAD